MCALVYTIQNKLYIIDGSRAESMKAIIELNLSDMKFTRMNDLESEFYQHSACHGPNDYLILTGGSNSLKCI